MRSNNVITILVSLFLILSLTPSISAQEDIERSPGFLGPDNGFLYGIDIALDNIRYALASQDNKVNVGLEIAEERLAEINNSNTTENIAKAELSRERTMGRLRERNNTETEKQQIEERLQKHVRVLEQVRERVGEQARQGIDTAIKNSQEGINRFQRLN